MLTATESEHTTISTFSGARRPTNQRWITYPSAPPEFFDELTGYEPLLAQMLYNRGVRSRAGAEAFISCHPVNSGDPWMLRDMDRAVSRILTALTVGERISVYGDFDADGVCGTALLVEALTEYGADVSPYIPSRLGDGYGLNCDALETIRAQGVSLIVTVDNGSSAVREVARARELGMDVVVTDHHNVPAHAPAPAAHVNPHHPDCGYPCKHLSGVGVAYKLVEALLDAHPLPQGAELKERLLDIMTLGTIADVMPLIEENRYLIKEGLRALNNTARFGLRALIAAAGLEPGRLDCESVSFALAPRLNAAGRFNDAMISYNLLTTASDVDARDLARQLEALNRERQRLTAELMLQAQQQIAEKGLDAPIQVVRGEAFQAGLVGLLAGKLSEQLYRPVVAIEVGPEQSRGSARSIPEFNIVEALHECADLLLRHGGHAQAAGFSIANENLPALEERLTAIATRELAGLDLRPALSCDIEVELRHLGPRMYQTVQALAPFGEGNPSPLFRTRRARVLSARVVGHNHLKLRLGDGRGTWDAIAFRLGEWCDLLTPNSDIDLVYSLELNTWNGRTSLQLNVKDLQPSV